MANIKRRRVDAAYRAKLLADAIAILKSPRNTFDMWPAFRKPDEALPTTPVQETLTRRQRRGTMATVNPDTTQGEPTMTDQTKQQADEAAAKAKIAAKEQKAAAAAEKKAAAEKAKAEKAEAAAKAKAERVEAAAKAKAERVEAAAKAKAEKLAAAAEAKANKPPRVRTYDGPLVGLADRAKTEYVKGANGQLHSNDGVAQALESVPADRVVPLLLEVFQEPNKYAHLNYGQQSMNYRNRLRGAITKGVEIGGVKITLDHLVAVRDAGGYATPAPAPESVAA